MTDFAHPALYCECGRLVADTTAIEADASLVLTGLCGCGLTVTRFREPLLSHFHQFAPEPSTSPSVTPDAASTEGTRGRSAAGPEGNTASPQSATGRSPIPALLLLPCAG